MGRITQEKTDVDVAQTKSAANVKVAAPAAAKSKMKSTKVVLSDDLAKLCCHSSASLFTRKSSAFDIFTARFAVAIYCYCSISISFRDLFNGLL